MSWKTRNKRMNIRRGEGEVLAERETGGEVIGGKV